MNGVQYDSVRPLRWAEGGLFMLDQRLLPHQYQEILYDNVADVAKAITDMVVRGAPAIGIAAAFGVALAARQRYDGSDSWRAVFDEDMVMLKAARPTAINLAWAVNRLCAMLDDIQGDPFSILLEEAQRIHDQDIQANYRMGELGAALIEERCAVMTHCNAGALATGGYGTALGVIRASCARDLVSQVYADETRPWMQGSRLTAWELLQDKIPVTLLAEGAGGHLMRQGEVKWLIVGSDRIAANGDVANKIGTYNAAIVARHHGVRVMVVAPTSTIDMDTASGDLIPIESRGSAELLSVGEIRLGAEGANAWNPVFDVTPANLVDAIVTEKGVVLEPNAAKMAELMARR